MEAIRVIVEVWNVERKSAIGKPKLQSTMSPKDRHDDLKSDVSTETKQSIKKIKSHKKLILSEPVTIDI
jgi:hypothetical protein